MLAEFKRNTNIGVGAGVAVSILGQSTARAAAGNPVNFVLGVVLAVGGLICYLWGCGQYARGKGYSSAVGLLGLLNVLGLLILVLLRDRHKGAQESVPAPAERVPPRLGGPE